MSEKCLGCGLGDKPLAPNAYRWVSEMSLPFHRVGGVVCLTQQLAQALEREATEKARADKAEQGLCGASNDLILLRERTEKVEFDCASLRLELQAEKHNHQKDNEHLLARAEKAAADLKTNTGLLAHQTDLAREAEIAKAKAEERERRLREASLPVAKQLDEPVVGGADGSRCRLVPEGLLRTLRKALAAKPQAPSAAEGEVPNDA